MYDEDSIQHYGIIGMRWGEHKKRESELRKKLDLLNANRNLDGTSDAKRFKYRNQNASVRIGKTAASVASQMLIGDILTGKVSGYANMSSKELTRKLTSIALTTGYNVAINDALAKSAANKYTDSGKRIRGKKYHSITKEDAIQMGVSTAVRVAPIARWMTMTKLNQVRSEREKNEKRFREWGSNILNDKVTNYVWNVKYRVE